MPWSRQKRGGRFAPAAGSKGHPRRRPTAAPLEINLRPHAASLDSQVLVLQHQCWIEKAAAEHRPPAQICQGTTASLPTPRLLSNTLVVPLLWSQALRETRMDHWTRELGLAFDKVDPENRGKRKPLTRKALNAQLVPKVAEMDARQLSRFLHNEANNVRPPKPVCALFRKQCSATVLLVCALFRPPRPRRPPRRPARRRHSLALH